VVYFLKDSIIKKVVRRVAVTIPDRKGVSLMVITTDHIIAFCSILTLILIIIDRIAKK